MITTHELEILCQESTRHAIELNIDRAPTEIALDKSVENAALIASQVKYLQRAKDKLPSLYASRCIIPPRAFEQSSSEATARDKRMAGGSVLELTCGLGIDALYLSKSFERVVTIERNEILAAVVRENFKRMGVSNVEVVTGTAEEYLANCEEHFDWVYVDPDRRVEGERRVVCLEGCSPNIVELMPRIGEIAPRVGIKCSPLFDVDEAFRIFGDVRVEVVSLLDECKEVMIYTGAPKTELAATGVGRFEFSVARAEVDNTPYIGEFNPAEYRYLMVVDVALQKSRLACHATRPFARMWSGNGFAFLSEATEFRYGRLLEIERIVEYHPRQLKREFKGLGAEIIMRDFAPSLTQVREKLGLKSGAQWRLALTTINGVQYLIVLK